MGATTFRTYGEGETPQKAFTDAKNKANYLHGHGGYTGTIAEKNTFILFDEYKDGLWEDPRIDDKWGPAGCVKEKEGVYNFFGWASE